MEAYWEVVKPIRIRDEEYKPGEVILLDEGRARTLLESGSIRPAVMSEVQNGTNDRCEQ